MQKNGLGIEPRFFAKEHLVSADLFDIKLVWGEDYDFYLKLRRLHVKEAWCKSRIFHNEPEKLMSILNKNYRYGKAIPDFHKIDRHIFPMLIKQTYVTVKESPKFVPKSFSLRIGILILLFFRVLAMAIGLMFRFRV